MAADRGGFGGGVGGGGGGFHAGGGAVGGGGTGEDAADGDGSREGNVSVGFGEGVSGCWHGYIREIRRQ